MVAGDLFIDMVMSGFSFWPEPGQEAAATEYCREIGGGAYLVRARLNAEWPFEPPEVSDWR